MSRAAASAAALAGVACLALVTLTAPGAHAATSAPSAQAQAPAPPGQPSPPPGTTIVSDGTDGKTAGMAIPNVDPQQSAEEVGRLKADGINTISLFVWWWMPQQSSNFVERCTNPAQQQSCTPTEPDTELEIQMAAAQKYGLRTILVPIFYCGSCQGGWRGTAQPSDLTAWFASYQQFMNHYADLAQQYGVSDLFIGSEMTSLEPDNQQWLSVISTTRQHFSGQIGYEENWDVLGNAHFLTSVDVVGVSAYFPLDDGQSPTLSTIVGDWTNSHASGYSGRNWVGTVQRLAAVTHKPILFGEVGYMSGDYAAKQPFLNFEGTVNWQLQSDLYQAVLETFHNYSWWAGAVWWEWYIPASTGGDNTRTPRGKTAEQLMQVWYARGWRPATAGTPLVLSPAAVSPDNPELAPPPSPSGSSGAGAGAQGGGAAARNGSRSATAGAAAAGAGHNPAAAGAPGKAGAAGTVRGQGAGGPSSASGSSNGATPATSPARHPIALLAIAFLAAAGLAALMAIGAYSSRSGRQRHRSASTG